MRKQLVLLACGLLALCLSVPIYTLAQDAKTDSTATPSSPAATTTPATPAAKSTHVMLTPAAIKWGEMPPAFRKGAQMAVLAGDPGAPGLFTIRIKMPAGYRIEPHWHPMDEHGTVISGTFLLGMGEKFDKSTMQTLPAGGYALLPAEMRHYAMSKTAAIVQVTGNGPFGITYVNPDDDPRNAKAAK